MANTNTSVATHSGDAPRDLLWALQEGEGTITSDEYRRRSEKRV